MAMRHTGRQKAGVKHMSFVKWLPAGFQRFAGFFRKPQRDAEFAAELKSHLRRSPHRPAPGVTSPSTETRTS